MSQRQLIIHIGAHKCGSSSFQELLTSEAPALQSKGIRYLHAGRGDSTNHHRLVRSLEADGSAASSRVPPPARKRIHAEFWAEIRDAEEDQLVISSEAFEHLTPADNIAFFRKIRREGISIHTLFFAREHVSLFNSTYVEVVRSFQCLKSIEDYFESRSRYFSRRFARVLRRWERWSDDIKVLEFSPQQMESFFLTQWGHEVALPHSRPGLGPVQVEAALLYGRYFASLSASKSVSLWDHLAFHEHLGEAAASQANDGRYWGITPALREQIIACTNQDRADCSAYYGLDLQSSTQRPLNVMTRPLTDEGRHEIATLVGDFVPQGHVQKYLSSSNPEKDQF